MFNPHHYNKEFAWLCTRNLLYSTIGLVWLLTLLASRDVGRVNAEGGLEGVEAEGGLEGVEAEGGLK